MAFSMVSKTLKIFILSSGVGVHLLASGRHRDVAEFALNPFFDIGRHQSRDTAAQHGNLSHRARGEESILVLSHHEYGLNAGGQLAVHQGHLVLEFEVRKGPKASN